MSPTRLFRFLTILALLFSPVSMMGGHAAKGAPAPTAATLHDAHSAASTGHCADMDRDSRTQRDSGIDCMTACSAIPAGDVQLAPHPVLVGLVLPAYLPSGLRGLHPGSDPPPPRFS